MVLETKGTDSGCCTWETMKDEMEVPMKSCNEEQVAALHEGIKNFSRHTQTTYNSESCHSLEDDEGSFSWEENEDDEGSYVWEEMLPEEEEGDFEIGEPGVSCDDLGWQERASMSTFSLYFDFDQSCRVSLLGASMEISVCTESTYDGIIVSVPTSVSQNADVAITHTEIDFESSSVTSEIIEMEEDSDQSKYEVKSEDSCSVMKSVITEACEERVDYRCGTVESFAERVRKRQEKRSRIMAQMTQLDSLTERGSDDFLESRQQRREKRSRIMAMMFEDSAQSEHEVKSEDSNSEVQSVIADACEERVDSRCGTVDFFEERVGKRKEKRSRIMAKMADLDSQMERGSDDFLERRQQRREKRCRIMAMMFDLGLSLSTIDYQIS